jgi:hypothetical protein
MASPLKGPDLFSSSAIATPLSPWSGPGGVSAPRGQLVYRQPVSTTSRSPSSVTRTIRTAPG